jgi:cytochrome c biogenesis protein CcmG, thiol:disulfide interchange protein DsbE
VRGRRAALAAVLLTGVMAGCTDEATPPSGSPGPDPAAAPFVPCAEQPGTPAAGAETLPAVDLGCLGGGSFDPGSAPGVPTVVNLWASWCGPCREELPVMQGLADVAGDRVAVVGVVSKDGTGQAVSFATDVGVTFPAAFDGDGALMTELGLNGLPYTYFLDASGAVVFTQVGPVDSLDELRGLVAEHLGVQL